MRSASVISPNTSALTERRWASSGDDTPARSAASSEAATASNRPRRCNRSTCTSRASSESGRQFQASFEIGNRSIAVADARRRACTDEIWAGQVVGKRDGFRRRAPCFVDETRREVDLRADELGVSVTGGILLVVESPRMCQGFAPCARIRVPGDRGDGREYLFGHAAGLEAIASSSS